MLIKGILEMGYLFKNIFPQSTDVKPAIKNRFDFIYRLYWASSLYVNTKLSMVWFHTKRLLQYCDAWNGVILADKCLAEQYFSWGEFRYVLVHFFRKYLRDVLKRKFVWRYVTFKRRASGKRWAESFCAIWNRNLIS